jgi:hypothetical protein
VAFFSFFGIAVMKVTNEVGIMKITRTPAPYGFFIPLQKAVLFRCQQYGYIASKMGTGILTQWSPS